LLALPFVFIGHPTFANEREQITVYLPEAPPLSSSSADRPRYANEITEQALLKCGFEVTFQYMPWKRAQALVQSDPNSIIIPLARTVQREPRFSWIVSIAPYHYAFATLGAPLNSLADITPSMSLAAVSGTAQLDFLLAEGFNIGQLTEMTSSRPMIDMISAGRVDAWFEGVPEVYYHYSTSETKPDLVVGESLYEVDLYIAGGLDFPKDRAQEIRGCVSEFKQTREYKDMVSAYLPGKNLSRVEETSSD
jgi:polar amino acid transport system substrate-binding protein